MGLSGDIEKLGEMHRQGRLTDDEYRDAKQSLLQGPRRTRGWTTVAAAGAVVALASFVGGTLLLQGDLPRPQPNTSDAPTVGTGQPATETANGTTDGPQVVQHAGLQLWVTDVDCDEDGEAAFSNDASADTKQCMLTVAVVHAGQDPARIWPSSSRIIDLDGTEVGGEATVSQSTITPGDSTAVDVSWTVANAVQPTVAVLVFDGDRVEVPVPATSS